MHSYTLRQTTKSESFSTSITFKPLGNGQVQILDYIFDAMGILPSGTEERVVSLEIARAEYKDKKSHGWE